MTRGDFPTKRKPPWSEEEFAQIARWHGLLQEDRSEKRNPAHQPQRLGVREQHEVEKALLTRHKRRKAAVEADLAEGSVVDRDTMDRALISASRAFVSRGDDLVRTLCRALKLNKEQAREAELLWHHTRRQLIEEGQLQLVAIDDEIFAAWRKKRRTGQKAAAAAIARAEATA